MEIRIELEDDVPPVGRVVVPTAGTDTDAPFIGWLGLLRALSDAMGSVNGKRGPPEASERGED